MSRSLRTSNYVRKLAFVVFAVAFPFAAAAQNTGQLGELPGQTRLQSDLGTAIAEDGTGPGDPLRGICPNMIDLGFTRGLATAAGDLFDHCGDLVNTAVRAAGDPNPSGIDLDVSGDELNVALTSIAHTQMPAIGRGASEITMIQAGAIGDRLYALREGAEGVQIAGHAFDTEGKRVDFDFELLEEMGAAGDDDRRLGGFVNLRGGFGDRDSNDEELGFDFFDVGATAGVDYRATRQMVLGLAGGYTFAERDFDRSGGDIDSNTASVFAFAGFQEQGFYLDALYGFSFHWIDTERRVFIPVGPAPTGGATGVDRNADGDTEATEHQVAGTLGYAFELGELSVGPVTRLEYIRLDVRGFNETGAGGLVLAYDDDDIDSLIYNLGAEASYDISTGFGVLTPQIRAEWAHQFEDDQREITARYRFDPTQTEFFVETKDPDRDYVDFSASVAAQFGGNFSAFVAYDTLFGHSDLDVHSFTLGGRLMF
jgi:uncharacterized protein YhjY with autotransporter beta-barrel domain